VAHDLVAENLNLPLSIPTTLSFFSVQLTDPPPHHTTTNSNFSKLTTL